MPPNQYPNASTAISAILLEAKQAGVGKLTRTALVKFLYLLDLYMAEQNEGNIWTAAPWIFHHFGPYSHDLATEIDRMARIGLITEITGGGGTSKDYVLYTVPEWSSARGFADIGLPTSVQLALSQDLRKFSGNLPALLDKVYFHTEPMRNVRPGDTLNFSSVRKTDIKKDIRQVQISIKEVSKAEKIRQLASKIGAKYAKRTCGLPTNYARPIYDEHFAAANVMDAPIEGEFEAYLTFSEA